MVIPDSTEEKIVGSTGEVCVCVKCHHRNIATAKFCGCCGVALSQKNIVKNKENFPTITKHFTNKKSNEKPKDVAANKQSFSLDLFLSKLKLRFKKKCEKYRNVDTAYRVVLMTAAMLIIFSGAISYAFFYDTEIVRVSSSSFSDVALDHPIYSLCHNLIKIRAIGVRQSNNLAPYEDISVAEWNYAIDCMINYYGMDYFRGLKISEKSFISLSLLRNKLNSMGFNGNGLADIKRINAFKCLENALVEAGCVI